MKAVSTSGEFAFLSIGGTARGIIAIGGVAHGIIAVGGVASAGVISIGMNAVGSVAALGMNAVAPISLSLINALGIYVAAGVNGWGAWSHASINSTGVTGHGGVNTNYSLIPAVVTIVVLIIASLVAPGRREPRASRSFMPLRRFLRSPDLAEAIVSARLEAVRGDSLDLSDGGQSLTIAGNELAAFHAAAIAQASQVPRPLVTAQLVRAEERVVLAEEASYRASPPEQTRSVIRCTALDVLPGRPGRLPQSASEVQWVIAWTARLAAAASVALLVWWGLR